MGHEHFDVKKILDSRWYGRGRGKHLEFKYKLLDYDDPSENSWERADLAYNLHEKIERFYKEYPRKAGVAQWRTIVPQTGAVDDESSEED